MNKIIISSRDDEFMGKVIEIVFNNGSRIAFDICRIGKNGSLDDVVKMYLYSYFSKKISINRININDYLSKDSELIFEDSLNLGLESEKEILKKTISSIIDNFNKYMDIENV